MTPRAWQAVIVSLLFAVVAATSSMVYANAVARHSVQSLCDLVATLDDAYRATPPQTPTGRQIAADVRDLRGDLDCPRTSAPR